MLKFLLDANLSPKTADFLKSRYNFDVVDLLSLKLGLLSDKEVATFAHKQKRIIITFDLDFGRIYHHDKLSPGIVILRIEDQTIESVNLILQNFFDSHNELKLPNNLIIIEDKRVRETRRN